MEALARGKTKIVVNSLEITSIDTPSGVFSFCEYCAVDNGCIIMLVMCWLEARYYTRR